MVPRNDQGQKLMVEVNHFRIKTLPFSAKIYTYDIKIVVSGNSIRPHEQKFKDGVQEPMNKALSQQVARAFLHKETQRVLGPDFVFDGVSQGWSPVLLGAVGQILSMTLNMGKRRDGAPNDVDFELRCTGELNIPALVTALRDGRAICRMSSLL